MTMTTLQQIVDAVSDETMEQIRAMGEQDVIEAIGAGCDIAICDDIDVDAWRAIEDLVGIDRSEHRSSGYHGATTPLRSAYAGGWNSQVRS